MRNKAAPCFLRNTNAYENMFCGHTIPRCLQIFQFSHIIHFMKHGLLNLIVNTVEGKTKLIKYRNLGTDGKTNSLVHTYHISWQASWTWGPCWSSHTLF